MRKQQVVPALRHCPAARRQRTRPLRRANQILLHHPVTPAPFPVVSALLAALEALEPVAEIECRRGRARFEACREVQPVEGRDLLNMLKNSSGGCPSVSGHGFSRAVSSTKSARVLTPAECPSATPPEKPGFRTPFGP